MSESDVTEVELIKADSGHLRGTLAQSLADPLTGALAADDTQLSKFHGIYQQDDRDIRSERKRQRLEPAYSFMIRVRIPGGVMTMGQWRNMDRIATQYANGTVRLTTRQAIQFHGVIKRDLGIDVDGVPGAGAAGGLGAGLVAFAGADIVSGIDTVLDALNFEERVTGATLCLTGEGRIDGQSLSGKACMGVAAAAARRGVPTVALVGDAGPNSGKCIAAGLSDIVVIGEEYPADYSIENASALLSAAAARVARQYAGNGDTIDG